LEAETSARQGFVSLDDIKSVTYYDMLTMYGGDLKFIFDFHGRKGGSNWHCPDCDWQRDQPLDRVCTPITPEMLTEWASKAKKGDRKCCSLDTPPLHNHPLDRRVPRLLHYELGFTPYIVESIEKVGKLLCTATANATQQAQVEKLACLGQELVVVLSEQADTAREWIAIATPYVKARDQLEQQQEEQDKAPVQLRSNYDKDITVLKNKLRRSQVEVDALSKKQSDQVAKVQELELKIEGARQVLDPVVLASCDWLRALIKKAMAAVGAVPQVYFGGTALVGNDCKRILGEFKKFLDILQEGIIARAKTMFPAGPERDKWAKVIDNKFSLWGPLLGSLDKFFALANSSLRITDQQLDKMDECIPIIRGLWMELYGDLSSAPPKIHQMLDHVMTFARRYRFFVHGGEQIGEKEHALDNKHGRQLSSKRKQHTKLEEGKEKLRKINNDPGQKLAAKRARDNTKRRRSDGKESKKTTNDASRKVAKFERRDNAVAAGSAVLLTHASLTLSDVA